MSVQTVLGKVKASDLGVTLTHEHFNLNFQHFYSPPPDRLKQFFTEEITINNLGFVRQYPYSSKPNVHFYGKDVDAAILDELEFFKKYGGGCIVENTSHGIIRNIDLMVMASKKSGIHVVAGTGHYVVQTQSQKTINQSVEELCAVIRQDMTIGCEENPEVKCGFIGEVGSSWPIHDFEKRAIQATAIMQSELGCAVNFHPGRDPEAPAEILRIYSEAGGDMKKANMSHLDRTLLTKEQLLEFAKIGSYCEFDLFGSECSFYQLNPAFDMRSDAQRIDMIQILLEDKKEDTILVSHDIHTKHRLMSFGGHGYSHLWVNVKSKMEAKGINKNDINKIFVENPATWLCH